MLWQVNAPAADVVAILRRIEWRQAVTLWLLGRILTKEGTIMAQLDDLEAKVAEQTTVNASAVTLLNTISQELKDALASNDPARIQAVIDHIDANDQSLAAAVAANTPAAPPTP